MCVAEKLLARSISEISLHLSAAAHTSKWSEGAAVCIPPDSTPPSDENLQTAPRTVIH